MVKACLYLDCAPEEKENLKESSVNLQLWGLTDIVVCGFWW